MESRLAEEGKQLTRIVKSLLLSSYRPKLDVSEILGPDASNWFQNIIIILNWIVELGRVDITNSVERLSTLLEKPRDGHLQAALHVFSYLNHYDRPKLVFDPSMPRNSGNFNKGKNWQEHYPDAEDKLPSNRPYPLGLLVRITFFSTRFTLVIIQLGAFTPVFSFALTMLSSAGTETARTL